MRLSVTSQLAVWKIGLSCIGFLLDITFMIDSVSSEGASSADLKRTKRVRRSQTAPSPTIDRLPPHSPEAEMGVLGCVLLSPNECMGECIEKLRSGDEVFYDLRHQTIFVTLAGR